MFKECLATLSKLNIEFIFYDLGKKLIIIFRTLCKLNALLNGITNYMFNYG